MPIRRRAIVALILLIVTTGVAIAVGLHVHQYGWVQIVGLVAFPAGLLTSVFPETNDVIWVLLMVGVFSVQYAYCWLLTLFFSRSTASK
jgi:hypothetical protein